MEPKHGDIKELTPEEMEWVFEDCSYRIPGEDLVQWPSGKKSRPIAVYHNNHGWYVAWQDVV